MSYVSASLIYVDTQGQFYRIVFVQLSSLAVTYEPILTLDSNLYRLYQQTPLADVTLLNGPGAYLPIGMIELRPLDCSIRYTFDIPLYIA